MKKKYVAVDSFVGGRGDRRMKNVRCIRGISVLVLVVFLMTVLTGCKDMNSRDEDVAKINKMKKQETESVDKPGKKDAVPEIEGVYLEKQLELTYADGFDVYYYSEGYKVVRVYDSAQYLLVPEGKEIPENLDSDMIVLQMPLNQIYLAATSAMALFDALNAVDAIRLSGTDVDGWYIEEAVAAMEEGEILYAGKYSEPDYERLIDEGCDLAVESTMILHTPKVQEMIEELGIPVFIDRSSYEKHPLGRTEWIKLYGAMLERDEEAEIFFDEQSKVIEELKDFKNTEKTVVFFYLNTDGSVVVRKSDDYIPAMIEIAGGRYIFKDLENAESKSASVKLTMEEFYAAAVDADYLIYNSAIDNPVDTLDELLGKSELFAEFRAVEGGNVWCTGKYLYQATDIVGNLIRDIHLMLTDGDESGMEFLYRVK